MSIIVRSPLPNGQILRVVARPETPENAVAYGLMYWETTMSDAFDETYGGLFFAFDDVASIAKPYSKVQPEVLAAIGVDAHIEDAACPSCGADLIIFGRKGLKSFLDGSLKDCVRCSSRAGKKIAQANKKIPSGSQISPKYLKRSIDEVAELLQYRVDSEVNSDTADQMFTPLQLQVLAVMRAGGVPREGLAECIVEMYEENFHEEPDDVDEIVEQALALMPTNVGSPEDAMRRAVGMMADMHETFEDGRNEVLNMERFKRGMITIEQMEAIAAVLTPAQLAACYGVLVTPLMRDYPDLVLHAVDILNGAAPEPPRVDEAEADEALASWLNSPNAEARDSFDDDADVEDDYLLPFGGYVGRDIEIAGDDFLLDSVLSGADMRTMDNVHLLQSVGIATAIPNVTLDFRWSETYPYRVRGVVLDMESPTSAFRVVLRGPRVDNPSSAALWRAVLQQYIHPLGVHRYSPDVVQEAIAEVFTDELLQSINLTGSALGIPPLNRHQEATARAALHAQLPSLTMTEAFLALDSCTYYRLDEAERLRLSPFAAEAFSGEAFITEIPFAASSEEFVETLIARWANPRMILALASARLEENQRCSQPVRDISIPAPRVSPNALPANTFTCSKALLHQLFGFLPHINRFSHIQTMLGEVDEMLNIDDSELLAINDGHGVRELIFPLLNELSVFTVEQLRDQLDLFEELSEQPDLMDLMARQEEGEALTEAEQAQLEDFAAKILRNMSPENRNQLGPSGWDPEEDDPFGLLPRD